jgi:hypothetical protein
MNAYVSRPDRPKRKLTDVGWGSWQGDRQIPTWQELPPWQSEFKEWIVGNYGPLPGGPVKEEDWKRWADAWMRRPEHPSNRHR